MVYLYYFKNLCDKCKILNEMHKQKFINCAMIKTDGFNSDICTLQN